MRDCGPLEPLHGVCWPVCGEDGGSMASSSVSGLGLRSKLLEAVSWEAAGSFPFCSCEGCGRAWG